MNAKGREKQFPRLLREFCIIMVLQQIYAYDAMGSFVAIPVGELAAGPLSMHYGSSAILLAAAVAVVIATVATGFTPAIRQLDNGRK